MTRGNQRELARQKNLKKQQQSKKQATATGKDGNKGVTLEARKQRDADIMREKQKKKEAAAASAGATGGGTSG
ncbi:DgyrCDS10965 [Dimorphilus gyrociliatus]|uniref:DgyrCDS10965 n=1 Tax=Dimorphilus gyrociliatus TaxID=2664684 RepID=A0A7I8W3A5_9ANNE|nr:DgyrCDS10965 [Dimorphilus gyrociliatus]